MIFYAADKRLFAKLKGGKTFSKIDLRDVYNQIRIREDFRELFVLSTHRGLFKPKEAMHGNASVPGLFQREIIAKLGLLNGVGILLDDVVITGETAEIHRERLFKVSKIVENSGLALKNSKCEIKNKNNEIKCMKQTPSSQNQKQLASWLGFISFYAQFIENRAHLLRPLYECTNARI